MTETAGKLDLDARSAMHAAVKSGDLAKVVDMHRKGCPLYPALCQDAAQYGQLHVLKYLHGNGCALDQITCAYVAYYGHLEMLK